MQKLSPETLVYEKCFLSLFALIHVAYAQIVTKLNLAKLYKTLAIENGNRKQLLSKFEEKFKGENNI
jgi:hypothetical protein